MVASFRKAFAQWGIPAGVLSDNGAVFTAKQRGDGRVALEIELGVLGVKFDHSRPYHPQTCGKVERFHQTQKKWLAAQPAAATIAALQRQLDRFTGYYNTQRPHRALDRRTPMEAYLARPKAIPTGIKIPAHYRVRNDTIDSGGTVTLRHNSRLHHIGARRQSPRNPRHPPDRRPAHPRHRPRHRRTDPRTHPRPQPGLPTPRTTPRPTQKEALNATMSQDTCQRCPETSHVRTRRDSNPQPSDP